MEKLKSHDCQDFSNTVSCGMCFEFKDTDSLVSLAHTIKAGHSQLPVTKNTKALAYSLLFYATMWYGHGCYFYNLRHICT